jgi:hypothetical protein
MTETDKTVHHPAPGAEPHRGLVEPPRGRAPVPDRGARPLGQVDEKAAEANREAAERMGATPTPFTAEQLATPSPAMAGHRQMWIIVGPYKGSVLTMPDAEAEDAKDSHWAVEMSTVSPPFNAGAEPEHDHELTDEDRAHAVEAANAWAANVNKPPEADDEPAVEGETADARREREQRNADRRKALPAGRRTMAMQPDRGSGGYTTKR